MAPVDYLTMLQEQLREEPTPDGMTSREIVRRAIEFEGPPRIPYSFIWNPNRSDIFTLIPFNFFLLRGDRGGVGSRYVDHWGVTWEVTGRTWDHAIGHPLADLSTLEGYGFPEFPLDSEVMIGLARTAHQRGKYVVGVNPVMMFETLRALMGFEDLMMAPYLQPDGLLALLDRMTDLTVGLVEAYADLGIVDGFMTFEDWGLQTSLQMKIDTFREFYKPSYRRVVDACHERGLHFIWHNCGFISDMFPDMIALGVDVVQLDQPRLMGHQELIDALGGRICMWNTVDIQWSTATERTIDEIRLEVADMVRIYDPVGHRGGFIAKHYPQPQDIELDPERQRAIYEAFMDHGCRLEETSVSG